MKNAMALCELTLVVISAIFGGLDTAHAIDWRNDHGAAVKEAEDSGRPILMDFYTDWCGWCKKLDADTYASGDVEKLSAEFVCVRVDGDASPGLVKSYGIRGFPTAVFADSKGKAIDTIVGYAGPDRFLKAMNDVLGKVGRPNGAAGAYCPPDSSKFILEGIVTTKRGPAAMINGIVACVGDAVEGATVSDIGDSTVRLRDGSRDITLEMK